MTKPTNDDRKLVDFNASDDPYALVNDEEMEILADSLPALEQVIAGRANGSAHSHLRLGHDTNSKIVRAFIERWHL